jgi:site-specific recombinase XerD
MREENQEGLTRLVDRYLESRSALNWSPRTIESYRSHLKVLRSFLASETAVDAITEVTPAILRRYQAHLYNWTDVGGRGRAVRTQEARLSAVRSFLRDLVRTEVLEHDPSSTLVLPKRRQTLPRAILTRREMTRFLAAPDRGTPPRPPRPGQRRGNGRGWRSSRLDTAGLP